MLPKPGSPGMGTTGPHLSRAPLASEAEATPGDDTTNPFDERQRERERETLLPTGEVADPPADPTPNLDDLPIW